MDRCDDYLSAAIALFLTCGALWLFADTLWSIGDEEARIENSILNSTLIEVGTYDGCTAKVSLSAWAELNKMAVYRWVVACEDAHP